MNWAANICEFYRVRQFNLHHMLFASFRSADLMVVNVCPTMSNANDENNNTI